MTEELGTALAEIPLAVLAAARTHARVTVVATGAGGVSISILTEGDAAVPHRPSAGGMTITSDRDGDLFWLEARWESPWPSPSSMTRTSSLPACGLGSPRTLLAA